MKKTLIVASCLVMLYSCKRTEVKPVSPVIDDNIVVTQPQTAIVLAGSSTYSFLGYGYDVTGHYADSTGVRKQAIDMASFSAANPNRFEIDRSTTAGTYFMEAINAEQMAYQLSMQLAETENSKSFKGAITDYYPDADALSSKYIYASSSVILQQKRMFLNSSAELLQNYLTATFRHDVTALSAQALVTKYGTHVLTDVILGARLNVLYRAQTTASDRLKAESEGFRFAMSKVFGVATGYIDPVDSTTLATVHSPQLSYRVAGADVTKLKAINHNKLTTININDWSHSSTVANAAFMNIGQNGLLPLDALIADPVQKAAVKAYITLYTINNRVTLVN